MLIKCNDCGTTVDTKDGVCSHCGSHIEKYETIVIPDSVTEIEDRAFQGYESLKNITIPDSVTKIGEWAFSRCSSLKSIILPNSITEIHILFALLHKILFYEIFFEFWEFCA